MARSSPTPKSSVALNSSVPANRLTSVAAVLKASSIPSERGDQKIKRRSDQHVHSFISTIVEGFSFWTRGVIATLTWAVWHVAGSGLSGGAGVAARACPLLVSISTGDTAGRPVAPVTFTVHVIWMRWTERERETDSLSADAGHMLSSLKPVSMPH